MNILKTIKVLNQGINAELERIGSDTLRKYYCKFEIEGKAWEGLTLTAVFSNRSKSTKKSAVLALDNTCEVPWEMLAEKGTVFVNLVGSEIQVGAGGAVNLVERMTTLRTELYEVVNVPIIAEGSIPPTPTEMEQVLALLKEARDIAQSVREDADAGKFDGYTPIKGKDYFDGYTPVKGKDYFTNGEIESFKNEVTPRRGVDYYTPSEIAEIKHEATPQRGTDYWTAEDVASINTESHTYIDNDMKGYTERASESARLSEQAFADFLRMLGTDVATLVGGKIPVSQIPAIATTEIYTVATEAERDKLSVQNGDICIVTYNDATKSKSFIYNNGWTYLASPTDYASKSGYSETCGTAENSNKINGHRLIQMSASEFEGAVKDNDTYYLVY